MAPCQRSALSDANRKAIRYFFFVEQKSSVKYRAVVDWFKSQHPNQSLAVSQVSRILGTRYRYLDAVTDDIPFREIKRAKSLHWPILEEILFERQQVMQQKGIPLTGEHLRAKPKELWGQLPHKTDEQAPKFSQGWLCKF